VFFEGNFVTEIQEKPDITMNILSGIYFFRPSLLELIPADEYFGMDHLIKSMLARRLPVAKYMIDEYWLDIGRMDDFEKAGDIYRTHFAANE
jgi:NDP-sugar pyrophosphorylase family protein